MKLIKIIQFLKTIITRPFMHDPKVMNSEETILYLLNNKKNICRYGDGELDIMLNKNINFQKNNQLLATRLKEIKNSDNVLVCIPDIFNKKHFNKSIIWEKGYKFWSKEKLIRGYNWRNFFGEKKQIYGDAFISRFYMRYKNKEKVQNYVNTLKKLWEDKDIIFVEGQNSRLGMGNDLFDNAKSKRRIICPNKNAFEKYNDILESVKMEAKPNDLVIIALGPTATILAYDLAKYNIWAFDFGHIDIEYEWFLAGVKDKIAIDGKNVNELNIVGETPKNGDEEYLSQIIKKIL